MTVELLKSWRGRAVGFVWLGMQPNVANVLVQRGIAKEVSDDVLSDDGRPENTNTNNDSVKRGRGRPLGSKKAARDSG
jgi:hypothetical protein